jgi:hypothetical protein
VSAAEQAHTLVQRYRGRLRWTQALVIACSEHDGVSLDPYRPDDAAMICRAETLALSGTPIRAAIQIAREEHAESRREHTGRARWVSPFGRVLPAAPAAAVCGESTHASLWAGRDGSCRCATCEPPRFDAEVIATAEAEEPPTGPNTAADKSGKGTA